MYLEYHDREWGVPEHSDRKLFEMLTLEGFQAGLSWLTILRKRSRFREAFDDFDPAAIAWYSETKVKQLLEDPGIVRNRQKVQAAVTNAQALMKVQQEVGSFDAYVWDFVGHQPIIGRWRSASEVPSTTPEAVRLSKDLKRRGFKFVGPTIVYAFMQAVGLAMDHTVSCFRYRELAKMA